MDEKSLHTEWIAAQIKTGTHKRWGKIMFEAHDTHGLAWSLIVKLASEVEAEMWEDFKKEWSKNEANWNKRKA